MEALQKNGWTARVVPVQRLDDAHGRVQAHLASGELPRPAADHLAQETIVTLPAEVPRPQAVVVAATRRPLTRAVVTVAGGEHVVPVPPHYAGYYSQPKRFEAALREALAPHGHMAALCQAPLKTLAAGTGLARYGRNNIAYIEGFGSYLLLAACVTDAAPPEDAVWGEALQLERCERCSACLRACPSGAIQEDRFLLHTECCLTFMNESEAPFPEWVDPGWHTCAVGCLRCQQVCPENARVDLAVEPPERFDARETGAILAGDQSMLSPATREKLERCGLDYSAALIARNLQAMLGL